MHHSRSALMWPSCLSPATWPSCRPPPPWWMPPSWRPTWPPWPRRGRASACDPTSRPTSAPNWPATSAAAATPGSPAPPSGRSRGWPPPGWAQDLLLANEVLDASRLGALVAAGARVTVAVDSPATVHAARRAGLREVLVDVNVGLPRCGCAPDDAGALADLARGAGLEVRGVMGYEGHAMIGGRPGRPGPPGRGEHGRAGTAPTPGGGPVPPPGGPAAATSTPRPPRCRPACTP